VGDGEDLREVYTQIKDNIYFPYTFDAKDLEYARALAASIPLGG
jgi:hypothetical protein